jgi:hypothetical protein
MGDFKFRVFDIFSYTLPGLIVLLCFYIYNYNFGITTLATVETAFKAISETKANTVLLILGCSFVIGNVLHFFGYNYFELIISLWTKPLEGRPKGLSGMEDKHVLVRQFSKENYGYIELWHAYRAMSFNLSLSFLLLSIVLVIKIIYNNSYHFDWLMTLACCFGSSLVTLHRAVTFHKWSIDVLEESVKMLKLSAESYRESDSSDTES